MTGSRTETAARSAGSSIRALANVDPRQLIKLIVYALLLVNYLHYIGVDIEAARHEMHAGWGLVDWARAFATTLDEAAWFLLLFLLELETYLLSDTAFTPTRVKIMHGLRLLCFIAIGHTVFAFAGTLLDLNRAVVHSDVSLCDFAEAGLSYTANLEYWDLNGGNCAELSGDSTLFQFAQGQVLSDRAGMSVEWQLAWIDLAEVVVWLLILAMIEWMVRLQDAGVTSGPALRFAQTLNTLLYGLLWIAAAWWCLLGHYVFAWDEALWILGFMAIGMNLSEWRKEIDEEVSDGSSSDPQTDAGIA